MSIKELNKGGRPSKAISVPITGMPSKALISPLFTGAGIKVKVIEALACGIPVIGTDIASIFKLRHSIHLI